jgi:hypothetical protein
VEGGLKNRKTVRQATGLSNSLLFFTQRRERPVSIPLCEIMPLLMSLRAASRILSVVLVTAEVRSVRKFIICGVYYHFFVDVAYFNLRRAAGRFIKTDIAEPG